MLLDHSITQQWNFPILLKRAGSTVIWMQQLNKIWLILGLKGAKSWIQADKKGTHDSAGEIITNSLLVTFQMTSWQTRYGIRMNLMEYYKKLNQFVLSRKNKFECINSHFSQSQSHSHQIVILRNGIYSNFFQKRKEDCQRVVEGSSRSHKFCPHRKTWSAHSQPIIPASPKSTKT